MLNRLIELLNRCQNFGIEEKFTDSGMKEFKIPNDYVANYLIVHGVLALDEEKVNVAMNLRPIVTAFGMPLNELAELIRAKEEGRCEEVKHGEWIQEWELEKGLEDNDEIPYIKCSLCGHMEWGIDKERDTTPNYCNECGAKMEKRKDENK